MVSIDLYEPNESEERLPIVVAGLKRLWTTHVHRRDRKRATFDLSRLDARLLRDMGIEPFDVYDAMQGRRRSILFHPMRRNDHE